MSSKVTLESVLATRSLWALDALLTQAMVEKSIQALMGGTNLDAIAGRIVALSVDSTDNQLVAAAIIGRLAAVVRGQRADAVRGRLDAALTQEPADIDTLQDGDMKAHAAAALSHVDAPWCESYLTRQAVLVDAADNARRELMTGSLRRLGALDKWIKGVADESALLQGLPGHLRLRRVRRIFQVMDDVVRLWQGKVGREAGQPLAALLRAFVRDADLKDRPRGGARVDSETVLFEALEHCLAILVRAIELRFSFALDPQTYEVLNTGVLVLGVSRWRRFLRGSRATMPRVRETLLEAILVLARQQRTDAALAKVVAHAHTSPRQASGAVGRHLGRVADLDPQIASWWSSLGHQKVEGLAVEQRFGTPEDEQIGELLIELHLGKSAVDRLTNEITPLLDISDPVSASTARVAAGKHRQVDQIGRRLGRMRRLKTTDLVGEVIEYNPSEQKLVGGYRPGVRDVRVVREGVLKDFGGRIRTIVRPWVEEE